MDTALINQRLDQIKRMIDDEIILVSIPYDGEPSAMEAILILESQNHPIDARFDTPQLAMNLGKVDRSTGEIRE